MTSIYKQFTVKDASGKVVRFGTCTDETFDKQVMNPGETVVQGLPATTVIPGDILGDTYVGNRIRNYPTIGDQLDALYHAMDAGILPKVPEFYNTIKAIKDKYPKV